LLLSASALADGPPVYREVVFRVVDENGHSLSDVEVQLRGLDRDALGINPDEEKTGKCRGWKFQTSAAGLLRARFGKFRQYDHEQVTGLIEPGFGRFHLVAGNKGSAGGVSCELLNLNDEDLAERKQHTDDSYREPQEGEEWQRGEFTSYVVSDQPEQKPIEIILKRGLDVTGEMVYTEGQPVRNEEVNLFLDLYAGSHTGHGGEIFEQQTTTDRHGNFHFHHVYPNHFFIALLDHSNGPPYWIRTRVRNRWVDKIEDEIVPHQDEWDANKYEKSISLLLVATRQPSYRYLGRVTDSQERAVAGAKVQIRCSLHEPERTFEDDHDYWWQTKTDERGNYSLRVGSRFVNAIWVTAGNNVGNDDAEEGDLMAPGRYDITVRPDKQRP
jgi:hypothetical protein